MRREEQEEKIASLLGGLDRVDAPHGFETRVMRRIADRGAGGEMHHSVLLLVLKFAAPAAMLLLLGMFFAFFGDGEVSNALVPPVQEPAAPIAPIPAEAPQVEGVLASRSPAEHRNSTQQPVNSSARSQPAASPRIMSEDFAVHGPGDTIRPEGLDPRPLTDPSAPGASSRRRIMPIEILDIIGIESACSPVNCTVRKVLPNSLASRSGVREGDVVVSIDERPIDSTHPFTGRLEIQSIAVRRDGHIVRLPLRN